MDAKIIKLEKQFNAHEDIEADEKSTSLMLAVNAVIDSPFHTKSNGSKIINILKKPRKNWDKSFKSMNRQKDDSILIDDILDFDLEEWEWK